MMLKAFLAIIFSVSSVVIQDRTVGDVKLPGTLTVEKEKLSLNGAGIREKYYIKMYVAGLYLKNKSTDALKTMNANETMAIRLHIISSMVSNSRMQQAIREGFEKSTHGNIAPHKKDIETLINAFNDPIKINDVFEVRYSPAAGCMIYKNGSKKATIAGIKFKQAVFGIWLGDNPNHKALRDELMKGK